jgi:formamidopyrimidine-DNA glycosylase
MPELPEVETTKNDLAKAVISKKITGLWIGLPKKVLIKSDFKNRNAEEIVFKETIEKIERKGKNIIFILSGQKSILIHQKISGHLLLGKWERFSGKWVTSDVNLSEKTNSFIHFIVFLNNGQMISLSDPRQFFKVEIWKSDDLKKSKTIRKMGPDALEIKEKEFKKLLEKRSGEIKKLLMNQEFLSGIGNIYSDEILWEAQISPFRKAKSLTEKEKNHLFCSINKILRKALRLKGDSISDYRLINGEKGEYQNFHNVYQREDLFCKRKDGGIIKRKKFGNRHLRYCPVCQK